jgi:putative ABC transport system permease protein
MYLPLTQFPQAVSVVAARTTGDPATLEAAIRRAVLAADPALAVSAFATLPSTVATSLGPQRLAATLLTLFAGIALVLALSGLYAVLAYLVTQRRLEIGIRMALGATRRQVVGLMMRSGLSLVGLGLGCGLVATGLIARAIRQQLFGVPPIDPGLYVAVGGCFAIVAALACLLPSWRASRIDPLVAFRLK